MSGKILVLGAGGNVGVPLVDELLRRGEAVKAASRNPQARAFAGAEPVRVDLEDASTIEAALVGVDRIYAISPTGYLDPMPLLGPVVDLAAARGIKVVLQTAIGVDADDNIPLRRLELHLQHSGTRFVIVRPNWFSDNFRTYWLDSVKRGELRLPAGEGKSSFVDARDIAAAASALLTTDRFDGQALVLTGPEALDYHEAARLLSDAAGRLVTYTPVSSDTFIAETAGVVLPEPHARLLAAIFYPVAQGWTAGVTNVVQKLAGKAPRPLARTIKDNAPVFVG
ncbi:MAG: NAD(P)H-binding protein [Mesorhizobium sp.]